MKFQYYPETDSLYIDLAERPSADSREVVPGVVLDFDADDICDRDGVEVRIDGSFHC